MCLGRFEFSRRALLVGGGAAAASMSIGAAEARVYPADMVPLVGPGYRPTERDETGLWKEMDRVEAAIAATRTDEVAGYHKLRSRRAGARRYVDLHIQYRSGTSLERAHSLAHEMRDAIEAALPRTEVLIHVEPETSLREGSEGPYRSG